LTGPNGKIELLDELARAGIDRRTLLRRAGAGALGLGLAQFLAACGGGGGGSDAARPGVIPRGEIADRLNFSNWRFYIDPKVLRDFERKFGTRVEYTEEITDNVKFFNKVHEQLERGSSGGRDMFVLTDWMASRMIRLGYVHRLDKSVLTNVEKNLLPALKNPSFDFGREFSVPWQSGLTGLIARTDRVRPQSVNDAFDPKLKGKVTMLAEMRDTIGLVLLGMGTKPELATLDQALEAVEKVEKAIRDGQIRRLTGKDYAADLVGGDTSLAFGWSGDAVNLEAENANIRFFVPKEGVNIWSDNMQVPIGAPHAYTAEKMINYVYDPEVQAKITSFVNYVSPVKGVKQVIETEDPATARNELIFPSDATLAKAHQHIELEPDEGQELDARFQEVIAAASGADRS